MFPGSKWCTGKCQSDIMLLSVIVRNENLGNSLKGSFHHMNVCYTMTMSKTHIRLEMEKDVRLILSVGT